MRKFLKSYSLLIVFILVTSAVFLVALQSRALFDFFMETCERSLRHKLIETSKRLAALATAEELAAYRQAEDMKRPDYQALRRKLVDFASEAEVVYAYFLRVENGQIQYIVDNDFDERTRVGLDTPATEAGVAPKITEAAAGQTAAESLGEYMEGWEGLISAYSPVFDRQGRVVAVAGVDINDEAIIKSKKMAKTLRVMEMTAVAAVFVSGLLGYISQRRETGAARVASVAKNRFLSHVSHEIRIPMNAIVGLCSMIEKDYGTPRGLEHLAVIKRAGRSMMAIINDLMDFSRIESGNLEISNKPYEVASLLNDAIMISRMKLEGKDVEFTADISPDIPGVLTGDETRLKEILFNLLSNAGKYTEKGFIKLTVKARRERDDQVLLTIEVSDSGIGMKPEDLDRLFSDYCRINDRRAAGIEGTGLGLSITRRLCRAMGGDVQVASTYRKGSTFTATIRQTAPPEVFTLGYVANKMSTRGETGTISFTAPDFRVLVVDDNEMNLIVAEGLLQPYGIIAATCLSGKEAVTRLKEQDYDLVLLDHMMPGMDGLETAAAIRALGGRFAELPIVALTANSAPGMDKMFLAKGFNDFLSKPVEIDKLNELLEKWVPREKRLHPEVWMAGTIDMAFKAGGM